jgi:hypothetical protein
MSNTNTQRRGWKVPAAAAAVLVLGIGGYAVAQGVHGDSPSQPSASAQPMQLRTAQSGGATMNLCVRLTPALLAQRQVAFSGTVSHIGKTSVLLNVDHWYRGGDASQVAISRPTSTQIPLEGSTAWSTGHRYLVTASQGVVGGCGYTLEWNAHMASVFAKAFSH